MRAQLEQFKNKFTAEIKNIADSKQLEEFKNRYLGRKGELAQILSGLKDVAAELRPQAGVFANQVKQELEALFENKFQELSSKLHVTGYMLHDLDVTLPGIRPSHGHLHPITQMQSEIEQFFCSMGFRVADGPEVESDFYNFEALNIPPNHPAREMQDTFYVKTKDQKPKVKNEINNNVVLRTHTSPVQIREMRKNGAPIRIIVPGRCFRNEATDARHEHTFYQMEGLMVDKNINLANLKAVLMAFAKFMYGEKTELRLRPKYYPFVEPGLNVEVTCFLCNGKGCRVCKKTGWMEIAGAGLVHPNVLKHGGIDSQKYSGFAFGFGFNRLVMLKYGIEDVRHFMSGDLRFIRQF